MFDLEILSAYGKTVGVAIGFPLTLLKVFAAAEKTPRFFRGALPWVGFATVVTLSVLVIEYMPEDYVALKATLIVAATALASLYAAAPGPRYLAASTSSRRYGG